MPRKPRIVHPRRAADLRRHEENLKAASHWAGVISKRTAELTQKALLPLQKAKEAKAQLDAKRARKPRNIVLSKRSLKTLRSPWSRKCWSGN